MGKERDERSRAGGNGQGYNNRHEPRNTRPRRYGGGPSEDAEGFTLAKGGRRAPVNTTEEVE